MIVSNQEKKRLKHVQPGFDQVILFTSSVEVLLPRGVWSSYVINRKVRIYYAGIKNGFHKYQLGCIETDYILKQTAHPTASLVKKLQAVFRLLVLGADMQGKLQKIYNLPYVQQEWIEQKTDLLAEYDHADKEKWDLILKMDLLLQNQDTLLDYLRLPNMYGLFFNGYWRNELCNDEITIEQLYGEELECKQFTECLQYSIQENSTQQLIKINILNNATLDEKITCTGSCVFLDGALDICKKKIENDSIIFNYSAKWIGLKQLFQL